MDYYASAPDRSIEDPLCRFSTVSRSQTLAQATNVSIELWRAADALLTQRLPGRKLMVRLLGRGGSGLDGAGQQQRTLSDDDGHSTQTQLDTVADQIRERYGGAWADASRNNVARHDPSSTT